MAGLALSIFLYIASLFILYIVIETAVRRGINSSVIGDSFKQKSETDTADKSFPKNDLDNE